MMTESDRVTWVPVTHLSNSGLMTDLLFHNVSLCPGHFVLYHLFLSHCSFNQFPSLFSHFFFLALLPSFSANLSFPPLLWETWFAESDWVCQSDIASLITEAQSPSEGHINRWGAMVHTRLRESVPVSSPHLPFTQNVCVFNTTLIPSKTHNLRHHQKRMHFILNLSYSNKITSRTFQLEMTVFFLNASLPLATNTWPSIIWRLPHEMWALLINFIIAHWHFSDVFLITLIDSFE